MALTDNLISYYTLNSTWWADSVWSNTMTETNTSYVSGKISNGCSFNGSTSTMRNWNITLSAWNSPYSLNCWVKLNAEIASWNWSILTLNPDWTNQDTIYVMSYAYNGWTRRLLYEHYYNWPETYHPITYNQTLWTSNWYMLTATYSWSSMTYYLNGTNVASWWWTGTYGSNAWPTYIKWLTIGSAYTNSAYSDRTNAIIDEVWYWDREITSSEVTALYNSWNWLSYPFWVNNSNFFMFF